MVDLPTFHPSVVYVDESGDHGPVSASYPVFVLAFCLFDKRQYADRIARDMQRLKFRYFGHDAVVLHERDIRKAREPFGRLRDQQFRTAFLSDLERMVEKAPFHLVAAVIRKDSLRGSSEAGTDPYHLAMRFGMERIATHLRLGEGDPPLHVVCESRGRLQDRDLDGAFVRACDPVGNTLGRSLNMRLILAPKHGNYSGMQLADLIAHPIGRHVLQPTQRNRAWDVLRDKFLRGPAGEIEGYGLEIYP